MTRRLRGCVGGGGKYSRMWLWRYAGCEARAAPALLVRVRVLLALVLLRWVDDGIAAGALLRQPCDFGAIV